MRGILCCLAIWCAVPGLALAGPWPRAEGGVFMALSAEQTKNDDRYTGLYAEYGLRARDTLGFELGHTSGETSAILWWQRALGRGEGPNHFTMMSGIGALERGNELLPLAVMGASWGRGFDSLPVLRQVPGGGWLSLDLRYKVAGAMKDEDEMAELAAEGAGLLSYITPEATAKAELTLGWHATDHLMLINQFRFEDRDDTGFSSKLAVSVVRDLWGPAKLELGVIEPLSGSGETAVKLGTWVEF